MSSRIPPELPPRHVPPALPPRPGTSTSASPVRPAQHEGSSKAELASRKAHTPTHTTPALSITTAPSDERLQSDQASGLSIKLLPPEEESALHPEASGIPAITHTAASSPECEASGRFALSRSSSNSSLHSMVSCSSGSQPARSRSSTESQRPFIQLYGKPTAEQQYQDALEELQALEVVRGRLGWQTT